MYLVNSFSLNMLAGEEEHLFLKKIDFNEAIIIINMARIRGEKIVNAIGHHDTDRLVRAMFHPSYTTGETTVIPPGERMTVLWPDDRDTVLLVAQYNGPRLPAGATRLPDGASIEWLVVVSLKDD